MCACERAVYKDECACVNVLTCVLYVCTLDSCAYV